MSIYDVSAIKNARSESKDYSRQCEERLNQLISQFYTAAKQAGTPLVKCLLAYSNREELCYPVIAQTVSRGDMKAYITTIAVKKNGELYAIAKDFKQLLINHCHGVIELMETVMQRALMGEPLSEDQIQVLYKRMR